MTNRPGLPKVADKKSKLQGIVKGCCIGCVSVFPDLARSLFIANVDNSWPITADTRLDGKKKIF